MRRQLSPARLVAIVSGLIALYSFAGVANRFFEAWAQVREARTENEELLELCRNGQARGAAIMRRACLEARAALASPIFFKAITKAVHDAFKDFSDTVGSPFKLLVFVLFLISSVTLPVVPWARMLLGQPVADPNGAPSNGVHFIEFAPPTDRRGRMRRKVSSAMKALRLRRHPSIHELEEGDLEPGHAILDVSPTVGAVPMPCAGWDELSFAGGVYGHAKRD